MLQQSYKALVRQMSRIYLSKLWFVMVEQFLMKYIWSVSGMCMVAIPLLLAESKSPSHSTDVISSRAQAYTTKKNLLVSTADAWERIFSSYKEVSVITICYSFTSWVFNNPDTLVLFVLTILDAYCRLWSWLDTHTDCQRCWMCSMTWSGRSIELLVRVVYRV